MSMIANGEYPHWGHGARRGDLISLTKRTNIQSSIHKLLREAHWKSISTLYTYIMPHTTQRIGIGHGAVCAIRGNENG